MLFNRRLRHRPCGFSLIEIMVVLVLIGLLAGIVTVSTRFYLTKGKQKAAAAQISSICTAVDTFYGVAGRYPANEEGLEILTRSGPSLSEAVIKQIPLDPWGRAYVYNNPGRRNEPYEVFTLGADGQEGGEGENKDIGSWDLNEQNRASH